MVLDFISQDVGWDVAYEAAEQSELGWPLHQPSVVFQPKRKYSMSSQEHTPSMVQSVGARGRVELGSSVRIVNWYKPLPISDGSGPNQ